MTIDVAAVRALAKNPAVVSAFPFLGLYSKKVAPRCCGGGSGAPDPRVAIAKIAKLPPARLRVLKELIGVTKITIWTVRAARVVSVDL